MNADFESNLTPENQSPPKPKGKGCLPIGLSVLFFILMLGCGGYRYSIIAFLTYFVCFILVLPVPALSSFWERMKLTKNWRIGLIVLVFFLGSALASMGTESSVEASTESNAASSSQIVVSESLASSQTISMDNAASDPSIAQSAISQNESVSESTANISFGQANALVSAKNYLSFTHFSYEGLRDQLEYEGFTADECQYAIDNCDADWNEQALGDAKDYLDSSAFSYEGLRQQLDYEEFTAEQCQYAIDNCGADWNEQAAKSAEQYLSFSSFSRQGLIDQLMYEGFTQEQAEYGVTQNGY